MKFWVNNLISGFNSRSGLNVQCVDCVWSRWSSVQLMSSYRPWKFTLKKTIKSIFLRVTNDHTWVLDDHTSSNVLLNLEGRCLLLVCWDRWQKVKHLNNHCYVNYHFIIDLDVADSDGNGLIESGCYLMVHLCYSSWYYSSVLVLSAAASHSEGFSWSSLTIAQYRTVKSLHDWCDKLLRTSLINLVLTCIVKKFIEFELPRVRLIVHNTSIFPFIIRNRDCLKV